MREVHPCPVEGCASLSGVAGSYQGLCYAHQQKRKRYRMTIEELSLADGVKLCQACGVELSTDNPAQRQTDHDHESGHVRGILCRDCNLAEGHLRDKEHAARLMAYVERTRKPSYNWAEDRRRWLERRGSVD